MDNAGSDDGYLVDVTIRDSNGGEAKEVVRVEVLNVAPFVTLNKSGVPVVLKVGESLTVSGSFTDPGKDTWTAKVDFDDGAGSKPLALKSDKTFLVKHSFNKPGTYLVEVDILDDDDGSGKAGLLVEVEEEEEEETEVPPLQVSVIGSNEVVLIWSAKPGQFLLQARGSWGSGADWAPVSEVPVTQGADQKVVLATDEGMMVFRLIKP